MGCEKLPTCIFFNDQMENMPGVAELLKTQYCRGTFDQCAASGSPPGSGAQRAPDLYPNHAARADEILASAG